MSGWDCQWKPFWIPIGDSFQKAYLEECIHMGDDSSSHLGEQCMANIPTMVQERPEEAVMTSRWRTWYAYLEAVWNPEYGILLGENGGTIASSEDLGATLFTRSSSVLFTERLKLLKWDPVGLRGCGLLKYRPSHYVGKDKPWCYLRTTYGWCSKGRCRISRAIRKETWYIFSSVPLRQKIA